jgi:hypothetical protein
MGDLYVDCFFLQPNRQGKMRRSFPGDAARLLDLEIPSQSRRLFCQMPHSTNGQSYNGPGGTLKLTQSSNNLHKWHTLVSRSPELSPKSLNHYIYASRSWFEDIGCQNPKGTYFCFIKYVQWQTDLPMI